MFKNPFRKKTNKSTVEKMQFDEYFIDVVTDTMTVWYAVNYKHQEAIHVQYYEGHIIKYEIAWTAILNATKNKQISKSEFLEAYDRAVNYLKEARP